MPFEPNKLLEVADHLLRTQGVDEQSRFRTALGRAYYAPLLVLKRRIEEVRGRGTVPKEGIHTKMRLALKAPKINHLDRIEAALGALRVDREDADYSIWKADIRREQVEDNIKKAEALIRTVVKELPNEKVEKIKF